MSSFESGVHNACYSLHTVLVKPDISDTDNYPKLRASITIAPHPDVPLSPSITDISSLSRYRILASIPLTVTTIYTTHGFGDVTDSEYIRVLLGGSRNTACYIYSRSLELIPILGRHPHTINTTACPPHFEKEKYSKQGSVA